MSFRCTRWIWSGALSAALLTLGAAANGERGYGDGPPPAHTGGFGEPTCARCHLDHPINDPDTHLRIEGLATSYVAGERYRITLMLSRPGMRRGGFQLAIRSIAEDRGGWPAGTVRTSSDRVRVVLAGEPPIQYAQHTVRGTLVTAADTATWVIEWTAPPEPVGQVVVDVAANAANDDASEFGDHIVVRRIFSSPRTSTDRPSRRALHEAMMVRF